MEDDIKGLLLFLLALFSTLGPCGFSPSYPGTLGAFLAAISSIFFPLNSLLVLALFILISIVSGDAAEELFNRKDPPQVVIDEFVGMYISTMFLKPDPFYIIFLFLTFRVFDIIKPFPVNLCENVKGGFGILLDDLVAGLMARASLELLVYLIKILKICT